MAVPPGEVELNVPTYHNEKGSVFNNKFLDGLKQSLQPGFIAAIHLSTHQFLFSIYNKDALSTKGKVTWFPRTLTL